MNYMLIALLALSTGCSMSTKQTALHDFGLPASTWANKSSQDDNKRAITVDAPSWLWDNRIRYRLLYSSPTQVGFYALDLWIASPPELFEQLLMVSVRTRNYALIIRLHDFEQQFIAPDQANVVLRFTAEAYSGGNKEKIALQEFYLKRPTTTPNAAGAVSGFAELTRQAADRIHAWLAGLPEK